MPVTTDPENQVSAAQRHQVRTHSFLCPRVVRRDHVGTRGLRPIGAFRPHIEKRRFKTFQCASGDWAVEDPFGNVRDGLGSESGAIAEMGEWANELGLFEDFSDAKRVAIDLTRDRLERTRKRPDLTLWPKTDMSAALDGVELPEGAEVLGGAKVRSGETGALVRLPDQSYHLYMKKRVFRLRRSVVERELSKINGSLAPKDADAGG